MNLFGFNITRSSARLRAEGTKFDERTQMAAIKAAAPNLPLRRDDSDMLNVLPPFGTNPPQRPASPAETTLDERAIHADPRELWYLSLPSKLTPTQVQQILRSAQGGDIWQQFQLTQLMFDTWPMLRKCDHELREAVSSVRYVARPYCEEGEEPTDSAKAKADLVNRCLRSMKPNPFTDERGFRGLVYSIAGGFIMGLTMEELLWEQPRNYPKFGRERRLRAVTFVHPRHFTFTNDGMIAVFDDHYNRLYYNLAKVGQSPDPRKFLCSQFQSTSGSTLGAGFMRSLAWWWTAVVFNREWMARMAQNYGAPFLDVTYKPGMTPQELATLDSNIKKGLANRFIRHLEGTVLNVSPGQAMGSENPQRFLASEADKQCQQLILGQTLTSDTSDHGGSLAQGEVHMSVRQDRIEGVAKWVGEQLTYLARSILLVNYSEDDECPSIEPDFTKPLSAMEQAQYLSTLSMCSLPVIAEDAYHKVGLTMPETGDKVVIRGEIGLLGETDQELDPSPEPPPPGREYPSGEIEESPNEEEVEPGQVEASLARFTAEQLTELEALIVKAERAPHLNGEYDRVLGMINNGA